VPIVIRPTWSPANDEQRRLLAEAERRAREFRRAEAAMWQAIVKAREADVPDTVLCERTEQSRATLNRRYGPRPAAASDRDHTESA
jgi:hypothetical protein